MDLQSILYNLFFGQPGIAATTIATIVIGLAAYLFKATKSNLYRLYIVAIAVAALLLDLGWYLQHEAILYTAILLLVVAILAPTITWAHYDKKLEGIAQKIDLISFSHNPVESYIMLRDLNEKHLIGSQIETYERYMVLAYILLGNCRVAKRLLEDKDEQSAMSSSTRHFFLHFIAEKAGDYEESQKQLIDAIGHKDDRKTDSIVAIELEHNQAVLHVNNGQFKAADDEFAKALARARELKVKNKALMNVLFENYAMNKTRLGLPGGGVQEGWAVIEDYASMLDPTLADDLMALFNLKLMFSRQISASQSEKNGLCFAHIHSMLSSRELSDTEKTIGMAGMARICWADALDPIPILDYFEASRGSLDDLKPADRYTVMSNIEITLANLQTDESSAESLSNYVAAYMQSYAIRDLDEWEESLPAEAYLLRAHILRQRAGLFQRAGDITRAKQFMEEATKLLEENLENMVAVDYKLALAQMLASVLPPNGSTRKGKAAEVQKLVNESEQFLLGLQENPSLIYPYTLISLCYALLNMPDECIRAYERSVGYQTSMDHYAPDVRRSKAIAALCARFFVFMRSLQELKNDNGAIRIGSAGRAWLKRFPEVLTSDTSILLGRFLGYEGGIPISRRPAIHVTDPVSIEHVWIHMPDCGMAFDPMLRNSETGVFGQVFMLDRHPLLNIEDEELRKINESGFQVYGQQIMVADESMLTRESREALSEILDALTRISASAKPTVEDVEEAYMNGIANLPAPE